MLYDSAGSQALEPVDRIPDETAILSGTCLRRTR
ncbi:hypothetical protein SAMN05216236_14529 [Sedimentitalea nanhaiensis]|uniref:Uncharacterized protein n=1 Tax=Sedimentitalea nanhaiensis TaxID=999627 RepID=A0A1I7E635_9RHOB|nr:hypothetical protein SAMN05216236_14529 [Sedimentitalea nanhaiensis]